MCKSYLLHYNNNLSEIILKKKLNYRFLVSVSHERDFAIAMVIALDNE